MSMHGPVAARVHPERTCIGCRTTRPRPELLRLVLPAGDEKAAVSVDAGGRGGGRGAYLCRISAADCLTSARRRRALTRALRTTAERIDAEALAAAVAAATAEHPTTPEVPSSPR